MSNCFIKGGLTQFKAIGSDMEFTCYGNVKGNVDHALDRTVDGAYQKSIDEHMKNGTMPKMFWNHQSWMPPVGAWTEMKEDDHGLFMKGRMLETDRGIEIYKGMKAQAIDSFSIGYRIPEGGERWNAEKQCNDLIQIDLKETSPVNFACNELSTIRDIKSALGDGKLLSKADLRHLLESFDIGLSKREIERVTAHYHPDTGMKNGELSELASALATSDLFK
mgnify:FL=1